MNDPAAVLPNCSLARALSAVGERWSLLIVREAFMGSTRFDEFHQRIGVARNILQSRLRILVETGVLVRKPSEANRRIPLYTLTERGWDLIPALIALMQWGDRWMDGGKGAPVVLIDPVSDKPIAKMCMRNGEGDPVDPRQLVLRPGPGADLRTKRRFSQHD